MTFMWVRREAVKVTTLCFTALSGTDLSGGAAHFAAVFATAGLEDPSSGGKSPRLVPKPRHSIPIISLCCDGMANLFTVSHRSLRRVAPRKTGFAGIIIIVVNSSDSALTPVGLK